jgi:hypothetical protein
MAIEFFVLVDEDNGANRYIQALLKDTAGNEVRLADETIASGASPSTIDLQAAWARGVPVENGIVQWRQKELEATDEIGRQAILAVLDIVRANGTFAQMIAAGEGVIGTNTLMQGAYNRFTNAINGGTAAQRWQFLAMLTTIAYSRLMQDNTP